MTINEEGIALNIRSYGLAADEPRTPDGFHWRGAVYLLRANLVTEHFEIFRRMNGRMVGGFPFLPQPGEPADRTLAERARAHLTEFGDETRPNLAVAHLREDLALELAQQPDDVANAAYGSFLESLAHALEEHWPIADLLTDPAALREEAVKSYAMANADREESLADLEREDDDADR